MDKLKVPLSLITEKGFTINAEVAAGELQPSDAGQIPVGAVQLAGTLVEVGGEYLFRGSVRGAVRHACDRCLEEIEQQFDAQVNWVFAQGAPAREEHGPTQDAEEEVEVALDEESGSFFQGNEIDLTRSVWEEVVLAIPVKFLCRPDCAGLCPQCGANLNRTVCRCQEEDTTKHKGLAGLADLFSNLRSEDPEE